MKAKFSLFSTSQREGKPEGWLGVQKFKYRNYHEMISAVELFLTELGPDRIISVETRSDDSVVVWHWE